MKIYFGILAITFSLVGAYPAHADPYHKYDLCDGKLPSGSFSSKKQSFTVRASVGGSDYDGSDGVINIHVNGTTEDIRFNSTFKGDQMNRFYSGKNSSGHFVKLNIKCKTISDRYCPAELITNISESVETYVLNGCLIDKVDYPAPSNPGNGQCGPRRCR